MTAHLAIRGRILDPASGLDGLGTVLIDGEKIQAVLPHGAPFDAIQILDAAPGQLILPGLIDLHAHCFQGKTALGLPPDPFGVEQGVTTLVDAGSSGVENLAQFREQVAGARTRVLAYLNLSQDGLARVRGELSNPALLAPEETVAALKAHSDFLVGVKARASASVVGDQGLAPVRLAKETAKAAGVPIMVHVGNAPPALEEVLDLLEAGDIVSHAFHGKKGGIYRDGRLIPEAKAALERGVLFDVAHGQSSFSFETARQFLAEGRMPDIISTDLWKGNETGPVFSQIHTMNKLLHLGMPLMEVVAASTWRPALALRRETEFGRLAPGLAADITLVEQVEERMEMTDSEGVMAVASTGLRLVATIRNGKVM